MPSLSAETFDRAFNPLSDDRIDRLAVLMGSIQRMDLVLGSCMMRDNGETLSVSTRYCAHCNAIHGHDHDGEDDCIHKRALRLSLLAEEQALEADRADWLESTTLEVGIQ